MSTRSLRRREDSLTKMPPEKRFKPNFSMGSPDFEDRESSPIIVERPEEFLDSDDIDDDFGHFGDGAGPSNRIVLRNENMGPSSPIPPSDNGKADLREAFQKCVTDLRPYNSTKAELDAWILHVPAKLTKLAIFSFGKYAQEMATAATEAVQNYIHIPKTVVLIPPTVKRHLTDDNKKISIHTGTHGPMTDIVSCTHGTKEILETIVDMDSDGTMFLFLSSPQGEDLFAWPHEELDMDQKMATLDVIRNAGATVEQMRICRARLSAIRGEKLARYIQQGSSHTLLISNAYPGPIRYEQCGIMETRPSNVVPYSVPDILKKLKLDRSKIAEAPFGVLTAPGEKDLYHYQNDRFTTCLVACNYTALHFLFENLTDMGYDAHIMNKPLTGCAMANGRLFAKLITKKISEDNFLIAGEKFDYRFPLALIFGGKLKGHGGPNLSLVRHCMDFLTVDGENPRYEFTFMSSATMGGALISNSDILKKSTRQKKTWRDFNNGANLLELEESVDLLDVQVLLLHRDLRPDMVPEIDHMGSPKASRPVSRITSPVPLNRGTRSHGTMNHDAPMTHYGTRCGNCGKTEDVKFRKEEDVLLCNACGLYFRKNGRHRPEFLIQARARAEVIPKSIKQTKNSKNSK